MKANLVHDNGVYSVYVLELAARHRDGDNENYHVICNRYGTIEFKESQLPNAIHVADTLKEVLKQVQPSLRVVKDAPVN
jgi:hypothetical protein